MTITFDVLDRFQENKVLQTAQIMNNIPRIRSSEKYLFGFNHSNHEFKTDFFLKKRAVVR